MTSPIVTSDKIGAIQITDGEQIVRVNRCEGAIKQICPAQDAQFRGQHFFVKDFIELDGAGTTGTFMFTTPDSDTRIHAFARFDASDEFTVSIYEDIETNNDGVSISTFNNDRESLITPELEAYAAPNVTSTGTLMWRSKVGAGKQSSGVADNFNYQILAKKNSKYLFWIEKKNPSTHFLDYDFWWYEHDPLDQITFE